LEKDIAMSLKPQQNTEPLRWIAMVLFLLCTMHGVGFSHGTKYEILPVQSIQIRALFESGEVMAGARVLVFRPEETVASDTLLTDQEGVFSFTPHKAGIWVFQVRQKDGHGMRINLPVTEDLLPDRSAQNAGPDVVQKSIMALCVLWGLIGTALFFKRRKS